jgi:hypothetical protein
MSQIAKKTGNLEEILKLKHETFANCLRSDGIIKIQFIRYLKEKRAKVDLSPLSVDNNQTKDGINIVRLKSE